MSQEYFSVVLSSDINLAIPLDSIRTIAQVETKNICAIPGVANYWYGVVNFKGSLLWILDCDRYFDLNSQQNAHSKKLTVIIIKCDQDSRQVALVTPKLTGIITVDSELEQLTNSASSELANCCDNIIVDENKSTYILDSERLLKQLHQQSMVSV